MDRRRLLGSLALGGTAIAAGKTIQPKRLLREDRRMPRSRIAVLNQFSYGGTFGDELKRGLKLFNLSLERKSVLLKPNLVEVEPGIEINTRPEVVGAAIDAFLSLGALEVLVAEGPGHQRDTMLVRIESGIEEQLRSRKIRFVDLNRDVPIRTKNRGVFTGLDSLWLPKTLFQADFVVSMPKMKTHHWAGVTLSMKNMFGVMPGDVYGWPKNVLHWQGIHEAILDICATVPPHLVIADGVIAMEGNGPLHGSHRLLGKLVLSDDAVAADFTCCRLMGLIPERVKYLAEASKFLGNGSFTRIEQIAENIVALDMPFQVVPEFISLRKKGS